MDSYLGEVLILRTTVDKLLLGYVKFGSGVKIYIMLCQIYLESVVKG